MNPQEREAAVREYAVAHEVAEDYVDRLLAAFAKGGDRVGWVATFEPYHGVLMLGILRGDVTYGRAP